MRRIRSELHEWKREADFGTISRISRIDETISLNTQITITSQRGIAVTNQRRSLDHELDELHEHTLLSVISAKAGIHFRTMSSPTAFKKITTEIQEIDSEQYR
jgi:hypothetical protein